MVNRKHSKCKDMRHDFSLLMLRTMALRGMLGDWPFVEDFWEYFSIPEHTVRMRADLDPWIRMTYKGKVKYDEDWLREKLFNQQPHLLEKVSTDETEERTGKNGQE
jgi:hypothetical protein